MSDEQIQVTVEQSAYDLMEGLVAVVLAVKAAKAGGVAAEAEAGVMAAIAAFSGKMGELQGLKAELLADHTGFYRGILNGGLDLAKAITG